MKKVVLVVAMGAFLFSCGKSACDCKTESEELVKEMFSSMGDESKLKELQDKAEDLKKDCEDFKEADYKECK
jgi:hypothetical protein